MGHGEGGQEGADDGAEAVGEDKTASRRDDFFLFHFLTGVRHRDGIDSEGKATKEPGKAEENGGLLNESKADGEDGRDETDGVDHFAPVGLVGPSADRPLETKAAKDEDGHEGAELREVHPESFDVDGNQAVDDGEHHARDDAASEAEGREAIEAGEIEAGALFDFRLFRFLESDGEDGESDEERDDAKR